VRRILTAAVLAAAVVSSAGCASTPPPVSEKVQTYYNENATPAALPSPPDSAFSLADVRGLIAGKKDLTVAVLGDSTGNGAGEWVDLWAQHLAKGATVTLHLWNEKRQEWLPDPLVYGDASRTIEIWDGAQPGASVDYGLAHLAQFQPQKPDILFFNYGHNQGKTSIVEGMFEISQTTDAKWKTKVPAIVTLQNPAQGDRKAISARSQYAAKLWASSAGYPFVDVTESFAAKPDLAALMIDPVHPNAAGSRIWADKVIATLG
jgi:hypothetical protein